MGMAGLAGVLAFVAISTAAKDARSARIAASPSRSGTEAVAPAWDVAPDR